MQNAMKVGNAPSKGDPKARVTVVMFTDFEDRFFARAQDTMAQLLAANPSDIRFVARNLPLSFHGYAKVAAERTNQPASPPTRPRPFLRPAGPPTARQPSLLCVVHLRRRSGRHRDSMQPEGAFGGERVPGNTNGHSRFQSFVQAEPLDQLIVRGG
jgi:hypothetical protein